MSQKQGNALSQTASLYVGNDVGEREDSMYSYNDKSYNSWKYGDEASLYSIAEDSREDRASEVPSQVGTDATSHVGTATVEVCWAGDRGVVVSQPVTTDNRAAAGGAAVEEPNYGYEPGPRRNFYLVSCVLVLAIMAIVLGVALSNRNGDEPRSTVGEGSTGGDENHDEPDAQVTQAPVPVPAPVPALPTPAPVPVPADPVPEPSPQILTTAAPAAAPSIFPPTDPEPTLPPTHSAAYVLARSFVEMALDACPGTTKFRDSTTPQGLTFDRIVAQLHSEITTGANGFIYFPLDFGVEFLREKYALEMLYLTTDGAGWWESERWMTDSDPCVGWHGIGVCKTREEGSCGVVEVNLNSNNLAGYIPEEMCCMPCLESLSLAGNRISGDIPTCLTTMGATVDIKNNLYSPEEEAIMSGRSFSP